VNRIEHLKTTTILGFKVYSRHNSDELVAWRYANREDANRGRVLINLAPETEIRSYACWQEVRVDTAAEAVAAARRAVEDGLIVVRIAAIRPTAPEFHREIGRTYRDFLAIGELMALAA
jgi:hypothetical protein